MTIRFLTPMTLRPAYAMNRPTLPSAPAVCEAPPLEERFDPLAGHFYPAVSRLHLELTAPLEDSRARCKSAQRVASR